MQRKAKNKKNGHHPTILSWWKADEEYRKSLGFFGIGEKDITLYDRIAVERHDYTAAKAERRRNSMHWVLSMNAEGPQPTTSTTTPRQCRSRKRMSADHKTSIWRQRSSSANQFIRANKCVNIRISNSKEVKIMTTLLVGKQDGNGTKSSSETCRILRLRRPHHGRISHGKIGIHGGGILQSRLTESE